MQIQFLLEELPLTLYSQQFIYNLNKTTNSKKNPREALKLLQNDESYYF